jgi:hypothetical protein
MFKRILILFVLIFHLVCIKELAWTSETVEVTLVKNIQIMIIIFITVLLVSTLKKRTLEIAPIKKFSKLSLFI